MQHTQQHCFDNINQCTVTDQFFIEQVIQAWQALQQQNPLVQCITNSVAANYVANLLLAAGASPAMIDNPHESAAFAQIAGGLNINLGTPTSEQIAAMQLAAQAAQRSHTPWVLDPVGYGALLHWRSETVDQLLQYSPHIIRGNASEISTLAGTVIQNKGVDSTLSSQIAAAHARPLLQSTACIAISGASDFIVSRQFDALIEIQGGHVNQTKITANGCALGALCAAYSAVSTNATIAAVTGHIHFAIAAQLAYKKAPQIGSFHAEFLNQIESLDANHIEQYACIKFLRHSS
ncbi:hydroxyethylthiazole kinase [Acinetobacter rudis]|uniref:hydroxyethylthiazole kinase n=1 Tax=Acinetobacter rudis TaxID=632955 RepID=UPI00280E68BB|nr:hydroxyethylthiazole kinase [Acinetobacter rudis]MDQ8953443.1 hydroxyethylthiazole kinase [Acinetobacter rudis]